MSRPFSRGSLQGAYDTFPDYSWVVVADYRKNSDVLGTTVSTHNSPRIPGFLKDPNFSTQPEYPLKLPLLPTPNSFKTSTALVLPQQLCVWQRVVRRGQLYLSMETLLSTHRLGRTCLGIHTRYVMNISCLYTERTTLLTDRTYSS